MVQFHKIFQFLFKSFRIDSETQLLKKIQSEGHTEVIIVKRSWVFILLIFWTPILLFLFLFSASYITFFFVGEKVMLTYITTISILFSALLFFVTFMYYLFTFRKLHRHIEVSQNIPLLIENLSRADTFFIRFFNWSYIVQICLIGAIIESIFLFTYATTILLVFFMSLEIILLGLSLFLVSYFRKKVIDLEMDYNIATQGKIYFVNQSGLLSQVQTIESDKIKSMQAVYPNKVAALFNFGTIHVLTEGDDKTAMGTMSMYYVKSPQMTVEAIQKILRKY